MKIEALNEDGTIRPASGDSCFEFSYVNPFSGSCRFTARVNAGEEKGLFVDPESIRWLDFRPKCGRDQLLSTHALTFFRHFLSRRDSLEQFESRVRPSILNSLWRKWILNRDDAAADHDLEPEERDAALAKGGIYGSKPAGNPPADRWSGAEGSGPAERPTAQPRGEPASQRRGAARGRGSIESLSNDLEEKAPSPNGAKRTHPAGPAAENLTLPFPELSQRKRE